MRLDSTAAARRGPRGHGRCAALIVATMILGCGEAERASYPPRKPTPGKAELPPTPELRPTLPPAQYEDGAWSVRGVLESGSAGRGDSSVDVRGYIAEVVTCADLDKGCKPAPHLLLTDREDLQGRRLLVGGPFAPGQPGIDKGKSITVRGQMIRTSPDGAYFAPGGLLYLDPPPPPAEDAAP
jgi:hypothetical protein